MLHFQQRGLGSQLSKKKPPRGYPVGEDYNPPSYYSQDFIDICEVHVRS